MFIIFGTRARVKQLGQAMQTCQRCRRDAVHSFATRQAWFTLFFIPVFPISRKRTLCVCNLCGQITQVADMSPEVLSTSAVTRSCPNCAQTLSADASICGACGHLLSGYDTAPAADRVQP